MSGEHIEITIQLLHIDPLVDNTLGSIDKDDSPSCVCLGYKLFYGIYKTKNIGDMGGRDYLDPLIQ